MNYFLVKKLFMDAFEKENLLVCASVKVKLACKWTNK